MAAGLTPRLARTDLASPLGRITVLATQRGIVRIAFDDEHPDRMAREIADDLGLAIGGRTPLVDRAATAIRAFLAGRSRSLRLPVDRALLPASDSFAARVLAATARIPRGRVATYGEVAARAGAPRAARAAGNALNANPIPLLIPCHRVVPSSGGIGGYGGGEWRKEFLLELEARR